MGLNQLSLKVLSSVTGQSVLFTCFCTCTCPVTEDSSCVRPETGIQWLRTAVCVRPDIMYYPLSLENLCQLNASAYAPFQWLRITRSVRPTWEDPVSETQNFVSNTVWARSGNQIIIIVRLLWSWLLHILEVFSSYLAHRWDCYGFREFLQANAWILSQTTPWLCPLILFPNSLFTNCPISDVMQSGLLKALLNKLTRTSKFHHI